MPMQKPTMPMSRPAMPKPMQKPMSKPATTVSKVKKPLPSIYDSIAGTKKTLDQMQVQITKIANMMAADAKAETNQ